MAFESVFSTECLDVKQPTVSEPENKWSGFFDKKPSTFVIDKAKLTSLKQWAQQQFKEAKYAKDYEYSMHKMHRWDGYISAINEILAMEGK